MRYNALSIVVMSLAVSSVKSLSLEPLDEAGLFDPEFYSDVPISPSELATFSVEADLNTQPGGEPIFPDFSGSSEVSDDLFEAEDSSIFSDLPDDGLINSNALVALDPNSGNSDQTQTGLPPSYADSGPNESPQDLGDTLENYINEGLNSILWIVNPFDKECDLKKGGKVALCCNSRRKKLPYAYGCKPYDRSNLDCQYFNYQFCCSAYNAIDNEGLGCTKGFYVE